MNEEHFNTLQLGTHDPNELKATKTQMFPYSQVPPTGVMLHMWESKHRHIENIETDF